MPTDYRIIDFDLKTVPESNRSALNKAWIRDPIGLAKIIIRFRKNTDLLWV